MGVLGFNSNVFSSPLFCTSSLVSRFLDHHFLWMYITYRETCKCPVWLLYDFFSAHYPLHKWYKSLGLGFRSMPKVNMMSTKYDVEKFKGKNNFSLAEKDEGSFDTKRSL